MSQKWFAFVGLFAAAALLLSLSSCAREQQLVGITIQPATATFGAPDPNAQIVFTAFGSYLHPPETKDLTGLVTWKTDVPQILTVNGGVASPAVGGGCGIANISASYTKGSSPGGNLITGHATVTINNSLISTCPGGSTTQAAVIVTLTGSGSVVSVPPGINCPTGACGALFTLASTVVLTGTPGTGASSVSWGNCGTTSGTTCSVVVGGPTTVTAKFQ
jgi:hypothetical protein